MNNEDLLIPFDLNSLDLSAMSLIHSIHPRFEPSYVFTKNLNDELVIRFNLKIFEIESTEDLTSKSRILNLK